MLQLVLTHAFWIPYIWDLLTCLCGEMIDFNATSLKSFDDGASYLEAFVKQCRFSISCAGRLLFWLGFLEFSFLCFSKLDSYAQLVISQDCRLYPKLEVEKIGSWSCNAFIYCQLLFTNGGRSISSTNQLICLPNSNVNTILIWNMFRHTYHTSMKVVWKPNQG